MNSTQLLEEPLLKEDESRYVMFPVKDKAIWEMYKRQLDSFWRVEEIDLEKDPNDWNNKLTDNERFFIKTILAFFAASDGIVLENIGSRFMTEVQLAEARAFYGFQTAMENIHSETYSLLIDTYIKNHEEKTMLFESLDHYDCIRRKADWAIKWNLDKESSFAKRLIAFACVEGIFFSGSFCAIFWLKKRGLMPGLTFSNELISRDEALHTEFAVLLYSRIVNKLSSQEIKDIISDAVEVEKYFICEALPCKLIGMNMEKMKQYIEYVADRLCLQLGCDSKIYNVSNPFDFMDMISMDTKTNFFESRVSEYSLADKTIKKNDLIFDEDF